MGERPPEPPSGEEWLPEETAESETSKADEPVALMRRLRSRIPVSPLPWHWHKRINRWTLIGIIVFAIVAAVASVLIQRASDDDPAKPAVVDAAPAVKAKLGKLSVEQKVDAVMVEGFDDPKAAAARLSAAELGGVIVGPEDWASGGAAVVSQLKRSGSGSGRTPPLIVGRQEGGIYRSYPDLPPDLRQVEIGDLGDPAQAASSAQQAGKALKAAGFDLNLAPVADVATLDSPIADRAYSDDPEIAAAMAASAIQGCKAAAIACAVSHFPGLGGANGDTANDPATVALDPLSLEARDISAFLAAFDAGAPATVLSLAFYAAYDPVTPGALSPSVATDLLRGELGFKGVAITDDLTSGAITAGVGAPEAAVQSVAAGADLVLVDDPAQAALARQTVLAAVRSGGIPEARLDEAVARVLELKRKQGLLPGK
jgi:beta-N-acetylhexosaminidase